MLNPALHCQNPKNRGCARVQGISGQNRQQPGKAAPAAQERSPCPSLRPCRGLVLRTAEGQGPVDTPSSKLHETPSAYASTTNTKRKETPAAHQESDRAGKPDLRLRWLSALHRRRRLGTARHRARAVPRHHHPPAQICLRSCTDRVVQAPAPARLGSVSSAA